MADPFNMENLSNSVPVTNPQDHGWGDKVPYDYDSYAKTSKELAEENEARANNGDEAAIHYAGAVGGVRVGEWHNNAAVYEWDDEYGDVGPEFPELERQLFGSEFHVKSGIDFQKLSTIKVVQEGEIRISPIFSFKDAGLHPVMLRNVELAGYEIPTPIQQYCLPAVFKGYDVVACAQTGSGKTAAFLIPTLSKLMGKAKKLCAPRPNPAKFQQGVTDPVRAEPLICIVVPSRELATQIFDEARRFCYRSMLRPCVVYGGGPIREQINQLQKGCDVLIGTPGRLVDFINRPHILTLKRLKYMIIDEADEIVGANWEDQMKTIMGGGDQEEGNINYLMFSATFPKQARQLAKEHLAMNHLRIRVGRAGSTHVNIKQEIIHVDPALKRTALQQYLLSMPPARTIIFVNSRRSADELDDFLFNSAFPCTSIHSDRTQREREDSIRAFRTGKTPILIATGVSARGLDIHNVMAVINFDLPSSNYGGIEEYCHRIGRTGRIGNTGVAMSFFTPRDEDLAPSLVKFLLETHHPIPDFLAHHIPEGFDASGEGNADLLDFGDDSDVEEEKNPDQNEASDNTFSQGAGADLWNADSSGDHQSKPTEEYKIEKENLW
ncbi:ATP-dependent RNA helicase ded1 [Erysiphe necator]|uniref:RNA helicase n=1 Tax=Uncinula necator TaxID=52586 RepID=A0A0B1P3U4_UNCNE|nr:ATP-dependent RNA helicase ded1 [Erysiphe necator]KHJ31616.1 putative atp-dependent rna helicase ded1 [Erysiphe necator]